jgi:hypothetical protein
MNVEFCWCGLNTGKTEGRETMYRDAIKKGIFCINPPVDNGRERITSEIPTFESPPTLQLYKNGIVMQVLGKDRRYLEGKLRSHIRW